MSIYGAFDHFPLQKYYVRFAAAFEAAVSFQRRASAQQVRRSALEKQATLFYSQQGRRADGE